MITLPSGTRVWICCGSSDLRNGFDGLAGLIQTQLAPALLMLGHRHAATSLPAGSPDGPFSENRTASDMLAVARTNRCSSFPSVAEL